VGASVTPVSGISAVAGASVAGISVAAGGSVAAPPPHAANRAANTNNDNRLNNGLLVFILFSPLSLVVSAGRSLVRYYITCFTEIRYEFSDIRATFHLDASVRSTKPLRLHGEVRMDIPIPNMITMDRLDQNGIAKRGVIR
jgi:hypothetical protein